jgi:hypothetical protein
VSGIGTSIHHFRVLIPATRISTRRLAARLLSGPGLPIHNAGQRAQEIEGLHVHADRRNPQTYITSTTLNRALERMNFLGEGTIGFAAHGFARRHRRC